MMLVLALLVGCTGDLSAFMPTVKFQRLDVKDLDFEAIDVDFVFDVQNPNPVGVPVDRFAYSLALGGVELLAGDAADGLEVRADGSSEIALPVGLVFENVWDTVEAVRGEDFVDFRLAGNFGFDTSIGPVDVAYDEAGSFPALRIPRIDLANMRVLDVGAEAVDFGIDMQVDNDHGSTLDFSNLAFDVEMAGRDVGGGAMEEVGAVEGATTKTLSIPISVGYAEAASALAAAASGERVNVDLAAEVDVDTPFGVLPLAIDEQGNVSVQSE